MATKRKPRRGLSQREVRGQQGATLPRREALSTLTPDPVIGYPTLPFEPIPYEPVADEPLQADAAAPTNEAQAENVHSAGATQSSSSTQNAPVSQS